MTHKRNLLLGITAGVMCLHLIFLYAISGMEVTFQTLGSGNLHDFQEGERLTAEELRQQREEELAQIFDQLEAEQPAEKRVEFDYLSAGSDFVMHSIGDLTELEELTDGREEAFLAIDEELMLSPTEEIEVSDLPDLPLEVEFEETRELVGSLMESTSVAAAILDRESLSDRLSSLELDSVDREASGLSGNKKTVSPSERNMLEMMEALGSGTQVGGGHALTDVAFGIEQPGTIASSLDFDVEVELTSAGEEKGYYFALRFLPKDGVQFKRVKHNMFFLIDRSHSIPKTRYNSFKEAVKSALRWMKPGDTFNVLVFDKNVVRLADRSLAWTQANVEKAEAFLDAQPSGGMFATTDLYTSLHKIVPDAVSDTEVNTAILFSDGDTYLRQDDQRRSIAEWTKSNRGKVSLYSVAAGNNNNLALLELLSSFNRGRLVYTEGEGEVKGALKRILQETRNPIGKDVMVTAIAESDRTRISLYPRQARLPDLYDGVPYTIIGSINELKPFTIFLQGKFYDRRFDIKQDITFEEIAGEGKDLARRVAVNRAYDHYEDFLRDGRVRHLTAAKRVLRKLKIPVAFQ